MLAKGEKAAGFDALSPQPEGATEGLEYGDGSEEYWDDENWEGNGDPAALDSLGRPVGVGKGRGAKGGANGKNSKGNGQGKKPSSRRGKDAVPDKTNKARNRRKGLDATLGRSAEKKAIGNMNAPIVSESQAQSRNPPRSSMADRKQVMLNSEHWEWS